MGDVCCHFFLNHCNKQAQEQVPDPNSPELAGRTYVGVAAAHAIAQHPDNCTFTWLITTALPCTRRTSVAGSCRWHALRQQTQYATAVSSYMAHPYVNIKSVQSWAPFQVLTRLQPPYTGGPCINNKQYSYSPAYRQQGRDEPHSFPQAEDHM
jgi:hypothetical protein